MMKKIVFGLLLCVISVSLFAQTYGIPPNQGRIYDPYQFGMISDSLHSQSAALQRCIDSAHVNGGKVVIRAGDFGISTKIKLYANVEIEGQGQATIFHALSGLDTMFYRNTADFTYTKGRQVGYMKMIHDVNINGSGIAAVGISIQFMYWFRVDNISIDSCTSIGLLMRGCLTGKLDNILVKHCPTGISARALTSIVTGPVAPNLMTFDNCRFYFANQWGLAVDSSQGNIAVRNCDFENNGIIHNPNSGSLKFDSAGSVGLYAENCWFEANNGTQIKLGFSGLINHTIVNCQIAVNPNSSVGLEINSPSSQTGVTLIGTIILNDSLDIYFKTLGFSGTGYYKNQMVTLINSRYLTTNQTSNVDLFFRDLSADNIGSNLRSATTAPSVTLKAGAGTSPTITVSSDADQIHGTVTIVTGTSPVLSDTVCILTAAHTPFTTASSVLITPANAAAAAIWSTAAMPWSTGSTNKIYIFSNSTALAASTTYKIQYVWAGK